MLGNGAGLFRACVDSSFHYSITPLLHYPIPPMIQLTTPVSEAAVRALKVGDEVGITGTLFTGRDAVHKYLHDGGQLPAGVNLKGGILYHCGPVIIKDEQGNWKCVAAGPTTSIREEPYQAQIIRDLGLRGVDRQGRHG